MKATLFTELVNTCDCCGKSNLKGTYVIIDEYLNEYYYGSTCVKRNLNISTSELTKQINDNYKKRVELAKIEYNNSDIVLQYNNALTQNYEYLSDFYLNVVKPLSLKSQNIKQALYKKYNINFF